MSGERNENGYPFFAYSCQSQSESLEQAYKGGHFLLTDLNAFSNFTQIHPQVKKLCGKIKLFKIKTFYFDYEEN